MYTILADMAKLNHDTMELEEFIVFIRKIKADLDVQFKDIL